MVPDFVALYAVVVVLFSLIYFSFASIPFLFVPFDVPEVSRLFRGLFNSYFWIVGVTSLVATAVFAASGRIAFTAEMLLLAATAMAVRTRVVPRIDTQLSACKSGDAAAMRRMRQIHWGSMLGNIIIIAAVASTVPLIV
jgi:hypothetical protein